MGGNRSLYQYRWFYVDYDNLLGYKETDPDKGCQLDNGWRIENHRAAISLIEYLPGQFDSCPGHPELYLPLEFEEAQEQEAPIFAGPRRRRLSPMWLDL